MFISFINLIAGILCIMLFIHLCYLKVEDSGLDKQTLMLVRITTLISIITSLGYFFYTYQ